MDCSTPGIAYAWDFGDGETAVTEGPTIGHAYAAPGLDFIQVRIAMPQGDTQEDATLSILDAGTGELLRTLALPRASRPFAVVATRREPRST